MPKFYCKFPGCHKVCLSAPYLDAHTRTHRGLRPFECTVPGCGKSFTIMSNLRVHMNVHDPLRNLHTCPHEQCGKKYKHTRSFLQHLQIHAMEAEEAASTSAAGRLSGLHTGEGTPTTPLASTDTGTSSPRSSSFSPSPANQDAMGLSFLLACPLLPPANLADSEQDSAGQTQAPSLPSSPTSPHRGVMDIKFLVGTS